MSNNRLTNELRENIRLKLMGLALAHAHVVPEEHLKAANDMFWLRHEAEVHKRLGVPKSRWPELIQEGMLIATTAIYPKGLVPKKRDCEGDDETFQEGHSEVPIIIVSRHHDNLDKDNAMTVLALPNFRGVSRFVIEPRHSWNLEVRFTSDSAQPSYRGADIIAGQTAILERLELARSALRETFAAANKLRYDLGVLLWSFKTEAQLLRAMPEAAPFVPQRERRNELVPKEFTDHIREAINKGIPPFNSGATK